jgi:dihydrofolate reductase
MALCPPDSTVWIIGGAEVYAQALPLANVAEITEIEAAYEGDAFAPQFDPQWRERARERHVSANGMKFSFVTYTRQPAEGN